MSEGDEYHRWYNDTRVWATTQFLGVPCLKSVCDLWNYQEILTGLQPDLIVEFGAYNGGSALFFAEIARMINPHADVLSFDLDLSRIHPRSLNHPRIRFINANSTGPLATEHILTARKSKAGPAFFIADSDHTKAHVLAELEQLRTVTRAGDYVVIEDGCINGHPVLPDWGEGPYEALEEYTAAHPNDYRRDELRELKFGWTFAPHGYLIRL